MDCFAQVVLEKQNNQTVASYTYGDDLISQNVAGGTSYFGYDGLGSTKFLTNDSGAITDTYQYDAYGEITNKTGTTDNNYLYTGEQYDRSLNQYYLRARYYNQGVGRFTQMDTWQGRMVQPVTLNKYLYGNGSPTMYVDPTGNFSSISSISAGLSGFATLSSTASFIGGNIVRKTSSKLLFYLASSRARTDAYIALATASSVAAVNASNVNEAIDKAIDGFEKFTKSKKFNDPQAGKHYVDIWGPSGLTLTPKVESGYQPLGSVQWQYVSGHKPGRLFQFVYKIGSRGLQTGAFFKFRIDYMDYHTNPPEFKPHYHLCGLGFEGNCNDHHYFGY